MPASRPFAVIARRLLGAGSAVLLLVVILGCMSVSFEGRKSIIHHDDQTYSQTGKLEVPPGQEIEIYYAVPYAGPPNLVVSSTFSECQVIEQRPDHFRVKNTMSSPREVTWTARGLKGPPAVVVVPAATPEIVPTASKP